MIKFSRNSITKILLIACLGIVFLGYFLLKKDASSSNVNNMNLERELKTQVNELWSKGIAALDLEMGERICPSIVGRYSDYPEAFFECNPHFFKCWVEGKLSKASEIKIGHSTFAPIGSSFHLNLDGSVNFSMRNDEKKYLFYLKRTCHQTEVPNRVFSLGNDPASRDLWDTFLQELKVDKFYVSQYEKKLLTDSSDSVTPSDTQPYLSFDLSQMKKICELKGGRILSRRLMSALSWFPAKVIKGFMHKSAVPWDKDLSLQESLEENYCGYFLSADCDVKNYSAYSQVSPGWISVYHLLGSEVEVLNNEASSKMSLKVSSRYFSSHSEVQKNSYHLTWNEKTGAEMDVEDENLKAKIDSGLIKGFAFRCMY